MYTTYEFSKILKSKGYFPNKSIFVNENNIWYIKTELENGNYGYNKIQNDGLNYVEYFYGKYVNSYSIFELITIYAKELFGDKDISVFGDLESDFEKIVNSDKEINEEYKEITKLVLNKLTMKAYGYHPMKVIELIQQGKDIYWIENYIIKNVIK